MAARATGDVREATYNQCGRRPRIRLWITCQMLTRTEARSAWLSVASAGAPPDEGVEKLNLQGLVTPRRPLKPVHILITEFFAITWLQYVSGKRISRQAIHLTQLLDPTPDAMHTGRSRMFVPLSLTALSERGNMLSAYI